MYPSQDIYDQSVFDCFEEKKERVKFIRKTLALFLISMFSTFVSCITFKYNDSLKNIILSEVGQVFTIISFVGTSLIIFITMCYDNLLRKYPFNYFIYCIFTLGISWLIGTSTIYIKTDILIAAITITTGVISSLIIYALITTSDFTGYSEYFFVALVAMILTGTINTVLHNSVIHLLIIGFGCLLFSLIIVYDIQMIVTQKHIKYKFSVNDSVLAAISLYIDSINLFIYILDFLTLGDRN